MQAWVGDGLRALIRFLRPYRLQAAGLIALGILASLLETIGISLLVPMLQTLTPHSAAGAAEPGNAMAEFLTRPFAGIPPAARIPVIVATMVLLIVMKNIASYALGMWTFWLQVRVQRDLTLAVFDQFMRVSYRFIAERQTGALLNHLGNETSRTGYALQNFIQVVAGVSLVVAYGVFMLMISWPLTLVAAAFLLTLSWLLRVVTRAGRKLGERLSVVNTRFSQISVETLAAMRLVRTFGREGLERDRYAGAMRDTHSVLLRSSALSQMVSPLSEVLSMIFLAFLLLVSTRFIIRDSELLIPLLLTFLFVLYRLLPRVGILNSLRLQTAMHLPAAAAVARMLDPHDKPYVVSGHRPFAGLKTAIRLDRVTFAYNGQEGPVLREVSLEIPAGRTTALVGASGVGKSTLADLLLRFYDPDVGRIIVDGVDLRELSLAHWRAAIGVVNQDTFVFNRTIRENIGYGRPDATEEEIIEAARQANAHDFIAALAHGYETVIGDRGVRLSTGQRQRIAIARAVLRNPEILILDEATSALDSESEWQVQQALQQLSGNRTVFVVAHRLSTIANAHQIVVLDEGRVVECGRHHDLLSRRGRYHDFWRLQSGEHVGPESKVPLATGNPGGGLMGREPRTTDAE